MNEKLEKKKTFIVYEYTIDRENAHFWCIPRSSGGVYHIQKYAKPIFNFVSRMNVEQNNNNGYRISCFVQLKCLINISKIIKNLTSKRI